MLIKELVAKFEKTTERYALFRANPHEQGEEYIVQVYIPRKQLNGTIPSQIKVSIQQL